MYDEVNISKPMCSGLGRQSPAMRSTSPAMRSTSPAMRSTSPVAPRDTAVTPPVVVDLFSTSQPAGLDLFAMGPSGGSEPFTGHNSPSRDPFSSTKSPAADLLSGGETMDLFSGQSSNLDPFSSGQPAQTGGQSEEMDLFPTTGAFAASSDSDLTGSLWCRVLTVLYFCNL